MFPNMAQKSATQKDPTSNIIYFVSSLGITNAVNIKHLHVHKNAGNCKSNNYFLRSYKNTHFLHVSQFQKQAYNDYIFSITCGSNKLIWLQSKLKPTWNTKALRFSMRTYQKIILNTEHQKNHNDHSNNS